MEFNKKNIGAIAIILVLFATWFMGNIVYTFSELSDGEFGILRREMRAPDEGEETPGFFSPNLKRFLISLAAAIIALAVMLNLYYFLFDSELELPQQFLIAIVSLSVFLLLFTLIPRTDICAQSIPGRGYVPVDPPALENGVDLPESATSPFMIPVLLMGALSGVFVFSMVVLWLKDKGEEEEEVKEVVAETIDRTLEDLYEGKDVRSSIMRCYAEMIDKLEEKGISEEDSFTPREFRAQAIKQLDVSQESVYKITSIFEEARYSNHELGEKEKETAIENLEKLKKELEVDR